MVTPDASDLSTALIAVPILDLPMFEYTGSDTIEGGNLGGLSVDIESAKNGQLQLDNEE